MSFISKTALLFLFAISIYAQGGIIRGKVVDKETPEPLIGANVILLGTLLGAATDINGYYEIKNIPPGIHSIKVGFIGYNAFIKDSVDINNSDILILNFELERDSTLLHIIIMTERPWIERKTTSCPPSWTVDMIPIREIYYLNILERFKLNPPDMQPVLLKDTTLNKIFPDKFMNGIQNPLNFSNRICYPAAAK